MSEAVNSRRHMMTITRYVWAALLFMTASALWAASAREEGFSISGTISNWPGGEAEVRAEVFNPTAPQVREEVATGIIANDGSFEITLPPITAGLLQSRLDRALARCEGVTVTPEDTRYSFSDFIVYRDGRAIAELNREPVHDGAWIAPVGSTSVTVQYFSNDATIQATCEQQDGSLTTMADIDVAPGWNTLVWTVTETRWPEEWHRTEVASVGGGEDVVWVIGGRGRIGVRLEPNEENSAVVAEVAPGSPAQQVGFLPGDVIVEVDGRDVRGRNPLAMIRGQPDTTVSIAVMREGGPEPIQFEVTRRVF
jgi:hypothetical protein